MNDIKELIDNTVKKYNLNTNEQHELVSKYEKDTRNIIVIESEVEALANYYFNQNMVQEAIKNSPPLKDNQNYYIRTYDDKSNIILTGVNIEHISTSNSGINETEKVSIDNTHTAYRKKTKVDVANNDLEIAICQIGSLLKVSSAEEYTVYNKDKEKDSIISRSVADPNYEEYYDFINLEQKIKKYINDGKIKSNYIKKYTNIQSIDSPENYVNIIDRSLDILKILPMVSQENIKSIRRSYFNMIIYGYITNQVDRNLNNYGIICNKKTKEYRFAPLFENSIISMPNLEANQCKLNGYICNRNKLIDCLFNNYYDDIKEKITYIITNKDKLIKNIDIIAKQNLDIHNYNLLMEKILNNLSYLEMKYQEKNNIIPVSTSGYVNAINMIILLSLIATISIVIANIIYKL